MSYSGYLEQQALPAANFTPAAGYGPQAKLKVSQPGDPLEQEADRMADRVVSGAPAKAAAPAPATTGVQRKCDACGTKESADRRGAETVQRQSEDEGEAPAGDAAESEQDDETTGVSAKLMPSADVVHRTAQRDSRDQEQDEEKVDSLSTKLSNPATASAGAGANSGRAGGSYIAAPVAAQIRSVQHASGRPLSRAVRRSMEPHFGRSLAGVRVHTDGQAARTAGAIKARAYTIGRNVVFNHGEYQPETIQGRGLLAHELTHVVQQGGA